MVRTISPEMGGSISDNSDNSEHINFRFAGHLRCSWLQLALSLTLWKSAAPFYMNNARTAIAAVCGPLNCSASCKLFCLFVGAGIIIFSINLDNLYALSLVARRINLINVNANTFDIFYCVYRSIDKRMLCMQSRNWFSHVAYYFNLINLALNNHILYALVISTCHGIFYNSGSKTQEVLLKWMDSIKQEDRTVDNVKETIFFTIVEYFECSEWQLLRA